MQKELDQLRAELDSLRRREYDLMQELIDVRAAAEIRSKKIDDIVKMQSVAVVDRLPVEILSRIIHLALSVTHYNEWERHPLWKGQFASVSHWWRDVILKSPSFWSTICVGFGWPSSYIKMQLARSGELPLDITIRKGFLLKNLQIPFAVHIAGAASPSGTCKPAARMIWYATYWMICGTIISPSQIPTCPRFRTF
ncbi:hypothetical protein F5141DRAFT_284527 [Pisolithus sp. B1]|nr:hypothetical protein F5141DRAFT_284527 [Pisolithus sp. B1]